MSVKSSYISILLLLLQFIVIKEAHALRELASYKEFTAYLENNERCNSRMIVIAKRNNPDAFYNESTELQRLLDGAKTILTLECPELNELIVKGVSAQDEVYRAIAAQSTDWKLIQMAIRSPIQIRQEIVKPNTSTTKKSSHVKEESNNTRVVGAVGSHKFKDEVQNSHDSERILTASECSKKYLRGPNYDEVLYRKCYRRWFKNRKSLRSEENDM